MFLFQKSGGGKVVFENGIEAKSSGSATGSGSGYQTVSKTTSTTTSGGGGGSATIEITQVNNRFFNSDLNLKLFNTDTAKLLIPE